MPSTIGPHRSPTINILFRIWVIFTAPIAGLAFLTGGPNSMLNIGYAFVAFCMCWSLPIASVIMRVIGPILWGDQWHEFIHSGGRPLLDALPWPFHSDSYWVRVGGRPEPNYKDSPSGFVPPKSWNAQCPSCGAMNATQYCVCWYCNANWTETGNGEGCIFDPPVDLTTQVDEYADRPQKVVFVHPSRRDGKQPFIHYDDQGDPYCIDDFGRRYWFWEDGELFYMD